MLVSVCLCYGAGQKNQVRFFISFSSDRASTRSAVSRPSEKVLVLGHVAFVLQQLFQISLERGLCFNHRIERLLHLGRQIICIDVLPLQFFPCHCLAPAWSDEKSKPQPSGRGMAAPIELAAGASNVPSAQEAGS